MSRFAFAMLTTVVLAGCVPSRPDRDNRPDRRERREALEWCSGKEIYNNDEVADEVRIACTAAVYGGTTP